MSYAPSASEALPRAPEPDSTLAFLREGYLFGLNRFRRLGTDAFEARLGLRRVLYVHGAEAAAMFYASDRFARRGAIPPSTLTLLQDFGSVQRLDGAAHRHRKAMFMRLLDVSAATRLVLEFRDEWERRLARWTHERALVLHDEIEAILCRAACRWAGVALAESEADARSRDFSAMIDGAGAIGARFARGMLARYRVERWLRDEIARLRARGEDDSPASCIAHHREPDGRPLDERVAAVELINLLRPTVALARWVTFAVLALHQSPLLRPRLLLHVVQEVRRFYPFFPAVGGRVRVPFEWRGRRFEPGEWVMLDLYATDHDVPAQDLTYPFDRLPSLPVSRFAIARVRGRR
jgi:fatty-acid peroxygenase